MVAAAEDLFVVYVREDKKKNGKYSTERQLVACRTKEEARMVRKENESPERQCIVRYMGPAGGGD